MSATHRPRLTFIDVARTYAILLALLSHVFAATGFFQQLGSDALLIRQFTRTATPLFMFMFGFMIEFVYARRAASDGVGVIRNRILARSFQCYMAYALTSFCAVLSGYLSLKGFLGSLLFFTDSRFGNILRSYSVMLLIAPFIIRLRLMFGAKFMFLALVAILVSHAFIDCLQTIDFGIFNHQFNMLFGIGLHKGGPSVYGALSFVLAGMFVASSLNRDRHGDDSRHSAFPFAASVLLVTVLLSGLVLIREDGAEAWRLFAGTAYRANNAPAYYIIGIIGSVITIVSIFFVVGDRALPEPIRYILPLGTSSLISYTAGNVILTLVGAKAGSMNLLVFVILFFATTLGITRNIERTPCYTVLSDLMNFKSGRRGRVHLPAGK